MKPKASEIVPYIMIGLRLTAVPAAAVMISNGHMGAALILILLSAALDYCGLSYYAGHKKNMRHPYVPVICDYAADKLFQLVCVYSWCWGYGVIPPIMPILLTIKELLIIIGWFILYRGTNVPLRALWYGKLATIVFYGVSALSALPFLIFGKVIAIEVLSEMLMLISLGVSMFAMIKYIAEYKKQRRRIIIDSITLTNKAVDSSDKSSADGMDNKDS